MRLFFVAVFGLLSLPSIAQGLAADMESVQACLRKNLPTHSVVQEIRLRAADAAGARELSTRVYGLELNEEVAVMISVVEPVDMSGSRYLVIAGSKKDAMYMYLPALGRARRIVGSQAGQSLWGTDFSYEDIKLVRGLMSHGAGTAKATEWEGRPAVAVSIEPTGEQQGETQYDKVNMIVDSESCVIVKSEFFDDAGAVKLMTVDPTDLVEADGRWYAKKVGIRSLREASRSELIVDSLTFDKNLPARLFNPRTFMHGR